MVGSGIEGRGEGKEELHNHHVEPDDLLLHVLALETQQH